MKLRLLGLLCIFVILLGAGCHIPDMERFDPVSGSLENMGVAESVHVVRDRNGIAHISAENDEDLFFAIGFSMAQDRFLIMDMLRRAGRGNISALVGSPVKYKGMSVDNIDKALQAFLFEEAAKKGVADLDPQNRKLLEAYTRGVNKYLEQGGKTIAIYKTWNSEPEQWRMEDCFLCAEIMGLTMTISSLVEEYYLERIRREHGDSVRDLFVPRYPDDATIITRDALMLADASVNIQRPFGLPGSNNWAIAGSRTVSGLPLLNNDPHVPNTIIPTFWWHCRLKSDNYDIMGLMFPGLPCFGAATNGKLSWALTNVMADYIDIWREKVNPDNPDEYMLNGKWVPFKKVERELKIKGRKKPKRFTMRMSEHGVILEQELLGWKVNEQPGEVLAMKYVDMDLARFFSGYQAMALAKDFDEWLAGAKDESWGPFAWNHTYADDQGNIAYWASGHFPIRGDNQGYIARKGWEPEQEWQGYVPFEENPHLVNPDKGYIATANNRVELPGYPYYITVDYAGPSRAARISEMIEQKEKHDVEDMKRMQYDVMVWSAQDMVPIILEDLKLSDKPVLVEAAKILEEWAVAGYISDEDSRGTCVYEVFMTKLSAAVFKDEIGKSIARGASNGGLFSAGLEKIIHDPTNVWFDDIKTNKTETRSHIVHKTMQESMKYLRKKLGRNSTQWRWGDISTITLSPSAIGMPGMTKRFGQGPYPLPGTGQTVRAGDQLFLGSLGFKGAIGPSSHWIVDFRDPTRAYYNATAGMADDPNGERYTNLTQDWFDGRYQVMSMHEEDYRDGMMGELVLKP